MNGEAHAEVALYGADTNAKLRGKFVLVKAGALVQEAEDVADALREFFPFGGSVGRPTSLWWWRNSMFFGGSHVLEGRLSCRSWAQSTGQVRHPVSQRAGDTFFFKNAARV